MVVMVVVVFVVVMVIVVGRGVVFFVWLLLRW